MSPILNNYKNITDNLIFISGITRSGKSILCPIISSFKKTENFTLNSIAEILLANIHTSLINEKVGKYLIKTSFNELLYNLSIGRNLNFKQTDYSSVIKNPNYKVYKKRSTIHENKLNYRSILKNKFFPIMFHDLMINPKLILEIFPKSKILNVERHPIDTIISWKKKGYGKQYLKNERNLILSFIKNNKLFPFYAFKNYNEFFKQNTDEDRIIFILWEIYKIFKNKYKILNKSQIKKVITVTFDEITTKTDKTLKTLETFLNIKKSKNTKKILKKENCPRKIDYSVRKIRTSKIERKISVLNKKKLVDLINIYKTKSFYI